MKYKFIPIMANHKGGGYENVEFLPAVISLMERYRHFLTDDFYPKTKVERFKSYIDLINELYPHFYVILDGDNTVGFVYLSNWQGNEERVYSAHLTCCFDKKYWGKGTLACADEFISMVKANSSLQKLKAQVFEHNFRVKKILKNVGFKFEGVAISETLQGGKPVNVVNYGLVFEACSEDASVRF